MVGQGFSDGFTANTSMASLAADFSPGSQQVPQSHWHAMRRPNESEAEAYDRYYRYVMEQIKRCNADGLGRALHAVQDSAAWGHRFHEYDGGVGLDHILADANPTSSQTMEALAKSRNVISLFKQLCPCKNY